MSEKLNIHDSARISELIAVSASRTPESERAFSSLVELYQKPIYNCVFYMLKNREDALDVTQEVFLRLWKMAHTYKGNASPTTWIIKIAKNCALDFVSRREGQRTLSLDTGEPDESESGIVYNIADTDTASNPPEALLEGERSEMLHRALATLDEKDREILSLRYFGRLSYSEIAEATSLEVGTLKSRMSRAKVKLKNILIEWNFF